MKKLLVILSFCLFQKTTFAQQQNISSLGREVKINLGLLTQQLGTANAKTDATLPKIDFPMPDGKTMSFQVKDSPLMENQAVEVKTYSAESADKQIQMRFTITPSGFSAIMHNADGYFIIEPIDAKKGTYRLYNMNESEHGKCNVDGQALGGKPVKNSRILSVAPFPVGTQLRSFRMAAVATSGMTAALGGKTQARDKIVSIINATNLIYEVEVAVRFSLIAQTTTSMTIILNNAGTDPFVVDASFANASNAQTGFTALNTNAVLPYNQYDVGSVFNAYTAGSGPTYFARGQAGPTPCEDDGKGTSWSEFVSTADLGVIVNLYAHETGHQFAAWHTFNAVGGSVANPTFCTGGWDGLTAIEPGSGTTMMGYGGNCNSPQNYVNTDPNIQSYFHTKSIEQILNTVTNQGTCATSTATGNTPPTATAGTAYTIPKGTPFMLTGTATDPNIADVLSYVWEEYDIATANDKGAFGSTINGVGGYSAVNSTASAPLFRSRISSSPARTFPSLAFILNNANAPAVNEAEALPQVSRAMKFRFTVRDNRAGGGGVDSDERIITVDGTKGPFQVTAPNTAVTFAAGSTQTVTWAVNGTNTLSPNIKISLSFDGGNNFPYTLSASTANNGTANVTIPANIPNSTTCRIRIASTNSVTAEFLDISDVNFSVTSNCLVASTSICPIATVTGLSGNAAFNLGLGYITGSKFINNSRSYPTAGAVQRPLINYTNNTHTTCQVSSFGNAASTLVAFRVSQTGVYSVSALSNNGSDAQPYTIFSSTNFTDCSSFVNANSNGAVGVTSHRDVTLNECTTYYALLYSGIFGAANNITLAIDGTGDVQEVLVNPTGFSYTYAAVNQANAQIVALSATSNFTNLGAGTFTVYGLQYANTVNPATFSNQTIAQAYGAGGCILLSDNSKTLNITASASPCQNSTQGSPITGVEVSGITKAPNTIFSTQTIDAGVNRVYQTGNSTNLLPGFVANKGSVFITQYGGCN